MTTTLREVLAAEIAPGIAHAICRELHGSTGYCVNCLSKAEAIYAPVMAEGFLAPVVAEWLRSEGVREAVGDAIIDNFHSPDAGHATWWLNKPEVADAALDAIRTCLGVDE